MCKLHVFNTFQRFESYRRHQIQKARKFFIVNGLRALLVLGHAPCTPRVLSLTKIP